MTTLKAVSSRIRFLLLLPLFTAGAVHGAPKSFVQQAQNPFDNNGDSLPDLGMAQPTTEGEKHLAEMAKAFGEASMTDNGLTAGQQARQFAFGKVRDAVSGEVNEQIESWLSPWGNANVNVLVDDDGNFNGSSGSWFIPWNDNTRYLSWSQLGLTQQTDGLVSNVGIGQRWATTPFTTTCWKTTCNVPGWAQRRGVKTCACRPITTSRSLAGSRVPTSANSAWRAGTT